MDIHFDMLDEPSSKELSSRKDSLIDTLTFTAPAVRRKDSVAPIACREIDADDKASSKSSVASNPDIVSSTDRVRRLSRKLSLRPPSNAYRDRERRESHPKFGDASHHTVMCECGRNIQVPCRNGAFSSLASSPAHVSSPPATVPTITLSGAESKIGTEEEEKASSERVVQPSLLDKIATIHINLDNYDTVLTACVEIGKVDDQDSLEAVLSRQNTIKSLLDAMKKFPHKPVLQLEACKSLLLQVKHSETCLQYLTGYDGIQLLHKNLKAFPENIDLLAIILDIVGFISSQEEWRSILSEKVNPSDFFTIMARHEGDINIVQKCCVVVGNLVMSEDLARSMMYVGGVHSLISMMTKYKQHTDILKDCCTALGTFASHDDTCQAVAEAGATQAVMSVMTSYTDNTTIQESCCWALASLSRSGATEYAKYANYTSPHLYKHWTHYLAFQRHLTMNISRDTPIHFRFDCICMELLYTDAFSRLLQTMTSFPLEVCIQEYGCWALCNLAVLGSRLEDCHCKSAMTILIDCINMFMGNVELLEHICYAINTLVALKECVQETVMTRDGIRRLIELMRTFEDNVDIQINSCKVFGNLAVKVNFRRYVEDMGASEAIISCMLKHDKDVQIQTTCCMTLTNLTADVGDNKYRVLKNGGVHAVLQAMTSFIDDENLQLNALKFLCNIIESEKGCWWIAEESGIQIISMVLKSFSESNDILAFGCACLANLARRGMNAVALQGVESILLYLCLSMSTCVEVAHSVCVFYENALKAGNECKKLFTSSALEKIIYIIQEFEDVEIQIVGCRIMALVVLGEEDKHYGVCPVVEVVWIEPRILGEDHGGMLGQVANVLLSTMKQRISDTNIQVICCAAVSHLSNTVEGLESLREQGCIETILASMSSHPDESQVHSFGLMALENICQADLVRGKYIQSVCDAVSKSMKGHPTIPAIQETGCHILGVIGTGFHKQNEQRRRSLDCLEPLVGMVKRRSVTEDIVGVASAAIQRIIKFKDDVLEGDEEESALYKEAVELVQAETTVRHRTSPVPMEETIEEEEPETVPAE